ncbi:unnamed protein product [Hymenolepis diminuta]|uniref:Uncharacterized protein n=1 Tax=Hymenolepis diminuta TaxID=6216 RepID=A0A564YY01_HYMDI|nr:unnamed protein product [Hymenolepis diminuta]
MDVSTLASDIWKAGNAMKPNWVARNLGEESQETTPDGPEIMSTVTFVGALMK